MRSSRTDCHTPGQWEALVEGKWKPRLVRLGACQSSTSAVRLTRLPCCRRECENAEQKLLFLNPAPDFTPICELPESLRQSPSRIRMSGRCPQIRMTDPFDDFSKAEGLDSNQDQNQTERGIFPPLSQRPAYVCYDEDFVVNDTRYKAGVYLHGSREEKNEEGETVEQPLDVWICSPLKVLCIVRAAAGNEHSYLIEYIEHGEETPRRTLLSQALLLGRAEEALKALRDLGVSVLYKHLKLVREYLDKQHLRFSARHPNYFWRSSKVVGWSPAPDCFVLPKEILSNNGEPARVWFDGKCDLYTKDGTLEEWKTNVAALCAGNPFLIFAVSAAFAGPLLELCNIPGIGFHFYGDSTSGKTTALVAGSSVWGSPSGFILSWRSTANGLESQAVIRSSIMIRAR